MALIDIFVFIGGIALGVYGHDTILKWIQGSEKFANNMKAKAAALEAQAQTTVNAVKNSVK